MYLSLPPLLVLLLWDVFKAYLFGAFDGFTRVTVMFAEDHDPAFYRLLDTFTAFQVALIQFVNVVESCLEEHADHFDLHVLTVFELF